MSLADKLRSIATNKRMEVLAKERAGLITEGQVEAILRPFAEKGQFEATINVNHTCTELLRSNACHTEQEIAAVYAKIRSFGIEFLVKDNQWKVSW